MLSYIHLAYGIEVCGNASKWIINGMESLQKKISCTTCKGNAYLPQKILATFFFTKSTLRKCFLGCF